MAKLLQNLLCVKPCSSSKLFKKKHLNKSIKIGCIIFFVFNRSAPGQLPKREATDWYGSTSAEPGQYIPRWESALSAVL